jgi:hypothetical protein
MTFVASIMIDWNFRDLCNRKILSLIEKNRVCTLYCGEYAITDNQNFCHTRENIFENGDDHSDSLVIDCTHDWTYRTCLSSSTGWYIPVESKARVPNYRSNRDLHFQRIQIKACDVTKKICQFFAFIWSTISSDCESIRNVSKYLCLFSVIFFSRFWLSIISKKHHFGAKTTIHTNIFITILRWWFENTLLTTFFGKNWTEHKLRKRFHCFSFKLTTDVIKNSQLSG